MWCRAAGLWAEDIGRYFSKDGQGGTLMQNQTHEKELSFQGEGILGEKTLQQDSCHLLNVFS